MTVGFFLTEIAGLKFFKETVGKFPQFDYAAYVHVGGENDAHTWFSRKGVDVVALDCTSNSSLTGVHLVDLQNLHEYLETNKSDEERGSRRDVHVTLNSEYQDKAIAEVLGGYFSAE